MRHVHPLILALIALFTIDCSQEQKTPPRELPPAKPAPAAKPKGAAHPVLARPTFAQTGAGSPTPVTLSDIAERAVRSVVNISSTRVVTREISPLHGNPFFDRFYRFHGMPQEQRARSLGSGVIVARDGVVVTNNHVVQEADDIRVTLFDGQTLEAKMIGTDRKSDLAVLRLQGDLSKIEPLPLGDSAKLRLGEVVLAIGNPFGVGQTVTMGIVSALGRADVGIVDYEDFIQTDAAINPGNSGGALINMRGELVGINTAILSRSGGYQGIGFAIPSAMARPIMKSLLEHGRVIRGWLGVVIQDLEEELAQAMGLPITRGVLVADVAPDSPASKAGVRRGDVISKLNGSLMESVTRLRNKVATIGPDAKVKLTLQRAGKSLDVMVTLGIQPGDRLAKLDRSQGVLGGLTLEGLTGQTRRQLGFPQDAAGVRVKSIERGSAAYAAGLRPGDVIVEINRQPVANPHQFSVLYRKAADRLLLLVFRAGSTLYMLLEK